MHKRIISAAVIVKIGKNYWMFRHLPNLSFVGIHVLVTMKVSRKEQVCQLHICQPHNMGQPNLKIVKVF